MMQGCMFSPALKLAHARVAGPLCCPPICERPTILAPSRQSSSASFLRILENLHDLSILQFAGDLERRFPAVIAFLESVIELGAGVYEKPDASGLC